MLRGRIRLFLVPVFALAFWAWGAQSVGGQAIQESPVSETFYFLESTNSATQSPVIAEGESLKADSAGREDIVKPPRERLGELEMAMRGQNPGSLWANPLKHAIRTAAAFGVSLETIVLLLLLPVVATIIAGARHLVGIRGFGIFLPAALSVVFLAIGPVVGVGLFLVIVVVSAVFRLFLRRLKIKLQYLPRMALILWVVALGVLGALFSAPFLPQLDLSEVSIFPVLILVLLSEDFTRVQLGKSARIAVGLTTETLVLALLSFTVLSLREVQYLTLLNPEMVLGSVVVADVLLGRYVGLRLLEFWRFRKLIRS